MKIISLGWGVQSFTLAAMVAMKELERVDFAIHADTLHESTLTYRFAERWTPWLKENGVEVITVSTDAQELGARAIVDIPAYTTGDKTNGQIRRQCTGDWKIAPMRRALSKMLEDAGLGKTPGIVEQWLGISLDEFQRMKDSDVKYVKSRWPLIEKRMTRADCVLWLERNGLEVPPKSACVFCPYHSMAGWRQIKSVPDDWKKAVEIDNQIRSARPPFDLYVHNKRIPLEMVDMRTPQERGQLSLFDDECTGICGV